MWTDTRFIPPEGYTSLSIGEIEYSKDHKSFNGVPTRAYAVDFKDFLHETLDCFEFFGPGVCMHGPSADSNALKPLFLQIHAPLHEHEYTKRHKLNPQV